MAFAAKAAKAIPFRNKRQMPLLPQPIALRKFLFRDSISGSRKLTSQSLCVGLKIVAHMHAYAPHAKRLEGREFLLIRRRPPRKNGFHTHFRKHPLVQRAQRFFLIAPSRVRPVDKVANVHFLPSLDAILANKTDHLSRLFERNGPVRRIRREIRASSLHAFRIRGPREVARGKVILLLAYGNFLQIAPILSRKMAQNQPSRFYALSRFHRPMPSFASALRNAFKIS